MFSVDREPRGSDRSIILPILVGYRFRPVRVRLIGGEAGLLVWVDIIEKLRIAVDFGPRNFHIGEAEWKVATRNGGNRCVLPLTPNCATLCKIGRIFLRMRQIAI